MGETLKGGLVEAIVGYGVHLKDGQYHEHYPEDMDGSTPKRAAILGLRARRRYLLKVSKELKDFKFKRIVGIKQTVRYAGCRQYGICADIETCTRECSLQPNVGYNSPACFKVREE